MKYFALCCSVLYCVAMCGSLFLLAPHIHMHMSELSFFHVLWTFFEWSMSHTWMGHDIYMNELCHICKCIMCLINEARRIYEWGTTHKWMNDFAYTNEPCHMYESVMIRVWMRHAMYECVMSHVWTTNFTSTNSSWNKHECFTSYLWMRHVTYINALFHIYERVMSRTWAAATAALSFSGSLICLSMLVTLCCVCVCVCVHVYVWGRIYHNFE